MPLCLSTAMVVPGQRQMFWGTVQIGPSCWLCTFETNEEYLKCAQRCAQKGDNLATTWVAAFACIGPSAVATQRDICMHPLVVECNQHPGHTNPCTSVHTLTTKKQTYGHHITAWHIEACLAARQGARLLRGLSSVSCWLSKWTAPRVSHIQAGCRAPSPQQPL